MKKVKVKKIICAVMSALMSLSLSACGNKDSVVEDYGTQDSEVVSSNEVEDTASATDSNSLNVSKASDKTLKEFFGDRVDWDDDFEIKGVPCSVNTYYDVMDIDGLDVYNMVLQGDGLDKEDDLVKALFGSTGKKLEEISYKNETDYMPLLYKYREIVNYSDFAGSEHNWEEEVYSDPLDYSVINSDFPEVYKWIDKENLYIHMYEGEYEGCKYSLLLGYDKNLLTRYIFLEPVSIKEYFSGNEYKTLLVTGSSDAIGNPLPISNACDIDSEELKNQAELFLKDDLLLDGSIDLTENPDQFMLLSVNHLAGYSSYANVISPNSTVFDKGRSVLMFTDSDYVSTIRRASEGSNVTYSILAEQRDVYDEYKQAHPNTQMSEEAFISSASSVVDELLDEPYSTVDGYALYLGNDSLIDIDNHNFFSMMMTDVPNYGIIKYTSKGLYGVDLCLLNEVTDIVPNVQLLEFDRVIESVKASLNEVLDLSKMKNPQSLNISAMGIGYYSYFEDENSSIYSKIPVWNFQLVGDNDGNKIASVVVNAMDGNLIEINYWGVE